MQFIPTTWAGAGRDNSGDGRADPANIDDAALAAAGYLCRGHRDLADPAALRAAIYSYNPSATYVRAVLAWTAGYTTAVVARLSTGRPVAPGPVATATPAPGTPPPDVTAPPPAPTASTPSVATTSSSVPSVPSVSAAPAASTMAPAPTASTERTSDPGRPRGFAGPAAGSALGPPPAPSAAVTPRAPQDQQEPDPRGPGATPAGSPSGSLLVVDLTPAGKSPRSPAVTDTLAPSGG